LYREAIPFYRKAIELAPFYLFSRFNLAWCLQNLGEFEEAEGYLREALDLNPRNPFSLVYLAENLERRQKLDGAEKLLNELESIDPKFRPSARYKAVLNAARGKKDEALELSRDSPWVYSVLGMRDEAIDIMQKTISEGNIYPYLSLIHNPFYDKLRGDPRFEKIVAQAKKTYEERLKKYGNILKEDRP
jgi:tetratricopeptide (TPR) repeat protein